MKKKEKKYGLLKIIGITLIIAFLFSWIFEAGQFSESGYVSSGMIRLGISDIFGLVDGSLYFVLKKVLMLLVIGGLYGVLSKIAAYDRLVTGIAKKLSKHKKVTAVVFSVLIAGLTSMLTQSFIVLLFVPFIISILSKMKLDKLSIFAITFGSMLVGIMGATFGTEGLVNYESGYLSGFNFYMNPENANVLIRAGILLIGLVLFNFFTLSRIDKKAKNEEETDIFELEPAKEAKKRSMVPIIIIGAFLLIISILGYMNWNGFKITVFDTFHTYLTTKVSIGKDFFIFKDLLGSAITAFGKWDLAMMIPLVGIFTIIIGLCYKVEWNEFIKNYIDGMKKMLIPIACVIAISMALAIVNTSYYTSFIVSKILSLTKGFNVVTMTLVGLVTSIFHTDLGFTGWLFNYYSYFATEFPDYMKTISVMLPTIYGLAQFFIPTSAILFVGLSSLKIKYTDWFKFAWKFILGMFLCLFIIFILMATI